MRDDLQQHHGGNTPAPSKVLSGSVDPGTSNSPQNTVPASLTVASGQLPYGTDPPPTGLQPSSISPAGGSQPHDNTQPTLIGSEMPVHTHALNAVESTATERQPPNQMFAVGEAMSFYRTGQPDTQMNPSMLTPGGGNLPHNNMQPFLALNFCVAMQGASSRRAVSGTGRPASGQ